MNNFKEFFDKELLVDIEIVSGLNPNLSIKCHKIILSKESDYFKNEFINDNKLKKIVLKKPKLPLEQVYNNDYTKDLLRFFYTDKTWKDMLEIGLNKSNCLLFFSIVDSFDFIKAKLMIEEYIVINYLTNNNCIDVCLEGINLQSQYIINKSILIIIENLKILLKNNYLKNKLLKLPVDIIIRIISQMNYELNNELLLFIIEFSNYNFKNPRNTIEQENNNKILNIFKKLNYSKFNEKFLKKIFNNDLFEYDKDLKIYLLNKIINKNSDNCIVNSVNTHNQYDEYENQNVIKNLNFIFEYNFDNNGIFYYLGTNGYSKEFNNPAKQNLIKIYANSKLYGNEYSIIDIQENNFQTDNIPDSYIIIDLLNDKWLIPYYYSIKNYNSDNLLIKWELTGSSDKVNWYLLDQRNETNLINMETLENTYTIHMDNIDFIKENYYESNKETFLGFKYFKITMKDCNSDRNYKLCLSNIEFYGIAIGKKWFDFY